MSVCSKHSGHISANGPCAAGAQGLRLSSSAQAITMILSAWLVLTLENLKVLFQTYRLHTLYS